MDQYENLENCSDRFLAVLKEYAESDHDVDDFKDRFLTWHGKIARREVSIPCYDFPLGAYFFNSDFSPLYERYILPRPQHPLSKAASEFYAALRGDEYRS